MIFHQFHLTQIIFNLNIWIIVIWTNYGTYLLFTVIPKFLYNGTRMFHRKVLGKLLLSYSIQSLCFPSRNHNQLWSTRKLQSQMPCIKRNIYIQIMKLLYSNAMGGFIYNFWCSLWSIHHLQMTSSKGFQHHFKSCLLWFLHEKEYSFYTNLFYCTEMRWLFISSTAIWVTGSDTNSVA